MAHAERNICTEENYQRIIDYTRNKTFKFKTREDIVEELKSIGILNHEDSASVATALLSRLVERSVMRIEFYVHAGDSNKYKFTGSEDKWHLKVSNKKEEYLTFDSGPEASLDSFIRSAWS
jgi:hypothetical protein